MISKKLCITGKRPSVKSLCIRLFSYLYAYTALTQNAWATPSKEHQVKAAIMYNLVRFSEWKTKNTSQQDKAPNTDFTLCVAHAGMREALQSLAGKPIHGRRLVVQILQHASEISAACNIAFLSEKEAQSLDLITLADLGVLTIGDGDTFLEHDGCMSIRRYGPKLGFSINRDAMAHANIHPSSKILRLSAEVR